MRIGAPLPVPRRALTAAEIEHYFPFETRIVCRGDWTIPDHLLVNTFQRRLGDRRSGSFNGILRYRYRRPEDADAMAAFALKHRLHRLVPGRSTGAPPEEVALEWERLAMERERILAWCREHNEHNLFREVVQTYRFQRRIGSASHVAHRAAADIVARLHPLIADPLNHAGILIEWAEKEHRRWFWECCRHQVL